MILRLSFFVWILPCLTVSVQALSSSSSPPISTSYKTNPIQSIDFSQLAVLDGGEWSSVQNVLKRNAMLASTESSKYGYMTVVAGKNENGQRMVGMQSFSSSEEVYQDSMALIPGSMKNEDAVATYIASLSAVHAVLPRAEGVGGSDDSVIGGKVIVLGGSDLACFAAQGLLSLGVDVCMVSPGNPKVPKKNSSSATTPGKLEILKPAVGSSETGFSTHVGKFDALLDTISNEGTGNDNDTTFAEEDYEYTFSSGSVLDLLKSRHNCLTYVSTQTHCQDLIAKEGILGGPRKADEYSQRVGQLSFLSNNPDCRPIPPPVHFGNTVEALLKNDVVFSAKDKEKMHQKSKSVRGWTLADFWEQSTWPRDSSSTGQVRFGLPVNEDVDLEDEFVIPSAPYVGQGQFDTIGIDDDDDEDSPPEPKQDNPFVYQVAGVKGVKSGIMNKESDCILFLSAKFCKTCKTINPQYTRMARISQQEKESPLVFAKAEASGRWGKELGRYFEVEAVPVFILFRKGQRFGAPLSVSRLPSRKITRAIELLESGADWDPSVFTEERLEP